MSGHNEKKDKKGTGTDHTRQRNNNRGTLTTTSEIILTFFQRFDVLVKLQLVQSVKHVVGADSRAMVLLTKVSRTVRQIHDEDSGSLLERKLGISADTDAVTTLEALEQVRT